MAEPENSAAPQQPSAEQLMKALEKAHLAGDTNGARELAAWHQELYKPAPEPEPPGMIERGANALRSLVSRPENQEPMQLTPEQGQAASQAADYGRRGPAPRQEAPAPEAQPELSPQEVDGFSGAARPAPEQAQNLNAGRGALERAGDLGAGALTAITAAAQSAEEAIPLGGFVWEEGKALPSYKTPEQYARYKEQGGQESLSVAADQLRDLDAGYVPTNTWDSVKQEFGENGALSGSAWGEVLAYGAEQGIQSIPDMVAATLSLPAYVLARSGEIGEARAENKGKEETELTDVLEAAPFALGSAILERIGAKGITQAGAESVGKEALKRGVGYAAARTAQEGGAAAGREAGTEFVQEGIIEYLGERFGTDAAMSFAEAAEMGLAGAVAGGVYGGAAGTATAGAREATRQSPEAELGRAMLQEADAAQFQGDPSQIAAERLAPENAQMQQAPGPVAAEAGPVRKSMADLVRDKLQERGIALPQEQPPKPITQEPTDLPGDAGLPDAAAEITVEPEQPNEATSAAQEATPSDGIPAAEESPAQQQAERRDASRADETLPQRAERLGFTRREQDQPGSPILTDPNGVELGPVNAERAEQLMNLWERGERDLASATPLGVKNDNRPAPVTGEQKPAATYTKPTEMELVKRDNGQVDFQSSVEQLGPVQEGYTRLYRASSPTVKFSDVFEAEGLGDFQRDDLTGVRYTNDPAYAEYYRSTYGRDAKVDVLDVRNEELEGRAVTDYEFIIDDGSSNAQASSEATPEKADNVELRANSQPFKTESSALSSAKARHARSIGRRVEAVPQEAGGFGFRIEPEAETQQRHRQTVLDAYRLAGSSYPGLGAERAATAARADEVIASELGVSGNRLAKIIDSVPMEERQAAYQESAGRQARQSYQALDEQSAPTMTSESNGQRQPRADQRVSSQVAQEAPVKQRRTPPSDTSAMRAPSTPIAQGENMAAHASPWAPSPAKPADDSDISSLAQDVPMPNWRPTYGMMGVNPRRPQSGDFKIGNRTIKLKPEDDPTRREGIRVMVTDLIGPRLYQGKVQGKTRLGFYRSSTSEVRIANFDDVEVMAHELAHYLDMHYAQNQRFTNAYRDPAVKSEVEQLSYTSDPKAVGKEGFAEFVRLWLTQYDEATARAPKFTAKFEQLLKTDKKLQRRMTRMQEEMHRWYQQGDLAQAYAVTSGNEYTLGQQTALFIAKRPGEMWRQRYVDKLHAAKVMGRTTSGGLRDASVDAYKQLQLLNGIEGISQESFKMGALSINQEGDITFSGPSLRDVWQKSLKSGPKMLREQELYFIARRAQELKSQGRENLISNGMIAEGMAMAKKHPHFEQAFSDYQAYRKNMMAFYVDSGYITQDAADAMMKANKNYVPFHRVVESVNSAYTAGGAGFQRLTGGQQNIKPVYDNMMMQEQRHMYAALKARALRSLYQDALKSQDGSLFLSKIGSDSKPVKAAVDQMASKTASAMADLGISISSNGQITGNGNAVVDRADIENYFEQNQEELMFWTFGHKPKTTETMVDSFIDGNGKRVWIEIQKENQLLVDMLDNMDYIALPEGAWGTAIKFAMKVKNFQTLTITSMAQFVGPNLFRDAQQAWMLSGGRFRPGWDTMIGLGAQLHSLVSQKGAWHEMKAQGGPAAGRVRTFYHENWGLASDVAYKPRQPYYHPAQWANAFLDVYMAIADSAEIATRLGFYMRMRPLVGAREAAWQAREISTDFRKHGTYAPWVLLQRTVPFLGAYVQSVDRDIRALAENKGEMKLSNLVKTDTGRATLNDIKVRIWMTGALIIGATAALALLNDDEERYRALTPDQKTRFFNLFIGGKHYTLPKPHGFISLMAQGMETAMDTMGRQSGKDAWKTMAFAMGYHFGGDAMPGVLNPVAEVALNRTFTGAPVVSRYAEDREARYQYTDRTPQLYINVGRALNVSPDRARHLLRGYTGYLSDFVDEYSEALLWDTTEWGPRPFARNFGDMMSKQFKPREVAYRTKWTTGYYELRNRAATAQANLSFLRNSEALRDQAPLEAFAANRVNAQLLGINKAFSNIDSAFSNQDEVLASIKYDPSLTAEEKETQIESYYAQKNEALGEFYRQVSESLEEVENELPDTN